jgi:ABC-type nitrate/sulfonate/bicarbonate transport system ATPase subunit
MNYTVTDTVLLDINVENFEYKPGMPVLKNVHQKIRNITRPDVAQGQVVAILGPSGIGKSTLFELIAGLRKPSQGSIKAYDREKHQLINIETGMVGMVYQSYELFPFLTVRKQLELGARKGGLEGNNAAQKIEFYLDHFGLKEHARKFPNELSGGQRQRLAIAQQILCSTNVLLMDEPFSGLDPLIKDSICSLIADVSQLDEMMSIIIVSHDIEPTLAIADTVWLMGRTENGAATIVESIDMMKLGFCWQKDIRNDLEFQKLVMEVTQKFTKLVQG